MPHSGSRGRTALQEFTLIRDLHKQFGRTGPNVILGIGDDAAIVSPRKGRQMVLTTDLLAEGVHFNLDTTTVEDLGYKAAVANLSDIAAMGAKPEYLLVSLAIPSTLTVREIKGLYRGLMSACRPYGVELIGGDTSASRHGLFVNIVLTGSVLAGHALTRRGARAGDLLYVTGTIGDSLAGLNLLSSRPGITRFSVGALQHAAQRLIRRHLRPTPRIHLGQMLSSRRLATSAIDLSDGLSGDIRHVCEQSRVGVELDAGSLPLSAELRAYANKSGHDPIELAVQGGEDYELLFTVKPRDRLRLDRLGRRVDCRVSCIGTVRPHAFGLRLRHPTGGLRPMPMTSYRHFQPTRHRHREVAWPR